MFPIPIFLLNSGGDDTPPVWYFIVALIHWPIYFILAHHALNTPFPISYITPDITPETIFLETIVSFFASLIWPVFDLVSLAAFGFYKLLV